MIIAVTRDNVDLINKVCNTLKHDVQIMNGVTNIKEKSIKTETLSNQNKKRFLSNLIKDKKH